jgi:hypothetical protein
MVTTEEYDRVRVVDEDERVSEAVARTVAAVSGRPPMELPPLQGSVDADALDRLFASSPDVGALRFTYVGYDVVVDGRRIRVRERR